MHAHAQTARAVRRSIKERRARVEQAFEACWEQVLLAAALEGELAAAREARGTRRKRPG